MDIRGGMEESKMIISEGKEEKKGKGNSRKGRWQRDKERKTKLLGSKERKSK